VTCLLRPQSPVGPASHPGHGSPAAPPIEPDRARSGPVAPARAASPWRCSSAQPLFHKTPPGERATDNSRALHPLIAAPTYASGLAQMPGVWAPNSQPVPSGSRGAAPHGKGTTRLSRAALTELDYLAGRRRGHNRAGVRHWRQMLRVFFTRAFARISRAAGALPPAPHEPSDLLPLRSALTPTAPPAVAA